MISQDARTIILDLLSTDIDRLNVDIWNDNDLTSVVIKVFGCLENFEHIYQIEFYD